MGFRRCFQGYIIGEKTMNKLFLICAFALTTAFAQTPIPLDDYKKELDAQELSLDKGALNEANLNAVRNGLNPIMDKIADNIRALEPELEAAQARLTQLTPPKPEEGKPAPVETDEVKKEREAQTKTVATLDAQLKQLRLLGLRYDQITQKITDKKRQLFAAQLLERNAGLFDYRMWQEGVEVSPALVRTSYGLLSDWQFFIQTGAGWGGIFSAFILLGLFIALWVFTKKFLRETPLNSLLSKQDTASERAISKILIAVQIALPLLLVTMACIWALDFAQLLPQRVRPILSALTMAIGLFAINRGLNVAVFNPKFAPLRLVNLNDAASLHLVAFFKRVSLIVAVTIVALSLLKVIYAPLSATILTTHIMLALVALAVLRYLLKYAQDDLGRLSFLRPLLWLFAITIVVSSLLGYSAFATYLVSRAILLLIVLCTVRLLVNLIDALVIDFFSQTGKYGERIAQQLGITTKRLELIGAILMSILRILLIFGAVMVVLGPWGIQSSESSARLDDQLFGLRFGDLRHSLSLGIIALLILVLGLMLTKGIGRWVSDKILPRTDMDVGLQNSLSTIFGYVGFVVSLFAALNFLGVSLGSITILAGALSVGIGFGLQSIVSNFVSGLILLAERPIRVGDSINVKGEEGRVKKISVRSTEIETFERSTVIIPNSELISGVVKNWTLANRQARITCAVRVAYDSDIDEVMEELLQAAKSLKNVQKDPLPKTYLARMLDNGLEFEVRVIVSNIDHILSTKSDLNIAILKRLNAKGIIVAPPEQRVQTKKQDTVIAHSP